MLDWRAMTVTVHLATRYKGHSLSVQYYEFYLHAILFLLLIQTQKVILLDQEELGGNTRLHQIIVILQDGGQGQVPDAPNWVSEGWRRRMIS